MKFASTREIKIANDTMLIIDGYSNKKTIRGAFNDLVRFGSKFSADLNDLKFEDMNAKSECFSIEISEVPSASRYNEEKEEMEYADGNYYCYVKCLK